MVIRNYVEQETKQQAIMDFRNAWSNLSRQDQCKAIDRLTKSIAWHLDEEVADVIYITTEDLFKSRSFALTKIEDIVLAFTCNNVFGKSFQCWWEDKINHFVATHYDRVVRRIERELKENYANDTELLQEWQEVKNDVSEIFVFTHENFTHTLDDPSLYGTWLNKEFHFYKDIEKAQDILIHEALTQGIEQVFNVNIDDYEK